MKVSTDWKFHLSHSFSVEKHSTKLTAGYWFGLTALVLLAVSWWFLGPPLEYQTLVFIDSADPFASHSEAVPASYVTFVTFVAFIIAALFVVAEDFCRYLDWKDELLTSDTLNELVFFTASANFSDYPGLRFHPTANQMTNGDLARWCRRYNRAIDAKPNAEEEDTRADVLNVLEDRLTGKIGPRPARLVKSAWYAPRRFEIARQFEDGWYYDTVV